MLRRCGVGPTLDDLTGEDWFDASEALPAAGAERHAVAADGITVGPLRCLAVPAPAFNRGLDRHGVKSALTLRGAAALLREAADLPGDEPVRVVADKLGGRNDYRPLLAEAYPGAKVAVILAGAGGSDYAVEVAGRRIGVSVGPRAESGHFAVALASMLAKYVREACMAQFNRWWRARVPGLRPTAGYPQDAARFLADVRPTLDGWGWPIDKVWRRK